MGGSFAWGFLAASSLIIGGAVALVWDVHERVLGLVMAFGSGVLISAVAFELVEEAYNTTGEKGGADRKDSNGKQATGSPLAIVLGIVLDGIPESIVLGLTIVVGGSVSTAYLAAVFISNVPEAFAASSGLELAGWRKSRILGLWVVVALVSGLFSLLGFGVFDTAGPTEIAFVLSFAAGAILTMLADTMMPEAFEHGGKLVGVATTLGFGVAFGLHALG